MSKPSRPERLHHGLGVILGFTGAAVILAAVLAGCSPATGTTTSAPPGTSPLPQVNPTVISAHPVWGKGWAAGDALPALRPSWKANEQLANKMAAESPWNWTGE
jgi:hypothetical protein